MNPFVLSLRIICDEVVDLCGKADLSTVIHNQNLGSSTV